MISVDGQHLLCAFCDRNSCAIGNAILYAHPVLSSMSVSRAIASPHHPTVNGERSGVERKGVVRDRRLTRRGATARLYTFTCGRASRVRPAAAHGVVVYLEDGTGPSHCLDVQ